MSASSPTDWTFGPHAPASWFALPAEEREARSELSSDQCIIDGEYFFLLGLLELPVIGSGNKFVWRVWLSVSEKSFQRANQLWTISGREAEPPCFGWLQTLLPYEPNTLNLKAMLHTQPVGVRPLVELEPTEHPLAVEQREGISPARAAQLATLALTTEGSQ